MVFASPALVAAKQHGQHFNKHINKHLKNELKHNLKHLHSSHYKKTHI
jgi:hypothetical protein